MTKEIFLTAVVLICGCDGQTNTQYAQKTNSGADTMGASEESAGMDGESDEKRVADRKSNTSDAVTSGGQNRIAYWWGKVNAHLTSGGAWTTDSDCSSGANIDPLTYCKKFFPTTTSVTAVGLTPKPALLWNTSGCGQQYSSDGLQEWTCNPLTCAPGFADCDQNPSNGCEVDLSNPSNCGACGNVCGSGVCGNKIITSMDSRPTNWSFNGSAFYNDVGYPHTGVLTRPVQGQAGTFVYTAPIRTDRFTLSFTILLSGGSGADGFAFVLETDGSVTPPTSGGEWVGIQGLHGIGIPVQTYPPPGNPNNGLLGVWSLNGPGSVTKWINPPINLPVQIRGTGWHTEVVDFDNGKITVKLDTQTALSNFTIPGFVSGTPYYYGFGGGTGWLTDGQEIRDVSITFPSPRCLAPEGISNPE